MAPTLYVRPRGRIPRLADELCEPFMRWVSGAPDEAPQETHRWNNVHVAVAAVAHLKIEWMVTRSRGDPTAKEFPAILSGTLAHLTRFGGWTSYIAVEPCEEGECWYLGCRWPGNGIYNGAMISRIATFGGVRGLVGPGPAEWFGISAWSHEQIPLRKIGEGKIGDGQPLTRLPLR